MSENQDAFDASELENNPNEAHKKKQFKIIMGVLAIIFVAFAYYLFSGDSNTEAQPKTALDAQTIDLPEPGNSSEKDEWRAVASQDQMQIQQTLNDLNSKIDAQNADNSNLKNDLASTRSQLAEIQNRPAEKVYVQPSNTNPPNNQTSGANPSYPNQQGLHGSSILSDPNSQTVDPSTGQVIPLPNGQGAIQVPVKSLGIIDMNKADDSQSQIAATTPRANKQIQDLTFIPDGSFVRVVMINGVDAGTGGQAQTDPIPVVFQTVGKFDMPNNYKMNVKGCRFLGSAWGELSSERVKVTIVSGSCIINGQAVPINVKGQVVGEDGKTGLRGKVVSKQGQILAKAALASAVEAVGSLYSSTVGTTSSSALGTVRTVDSKDVKNAAIGGGISGGAEKLSEYYMQRANELFPVIEVGAGRTVEILVQKGATVPNKFLIASKANNSSTSKRILVDD